MPVITPQARGSVSASTSDSYVAPLRKTITANTQASLNHNPFSAPDKEPRQEAEAAETTPENGQADTKVEDTSQSTVTLSSQATAIARMEQKVRKQEQALKADKAKLDAERAEVAQLKELKTKLAAKDYSALEAEGVTYEEYTNYKLNQGADETPEIQAIRKLEAEIKSLKTSQEDATTKQYDATIGQYRNDIKALVSKDPTYSSVKELKAEEHVLQHILDTFEQDGEVLSVEQAAQEVEDQLIEDAERMAGLSKLKAKQASSEPVKKELPPPKQGIKTITQNLPATQPKTFGQFQHLSPKERLLQAVAKAQRQQ